MGWFRSRSRLGSLLALLALALQLALSFGHVHVAAITSHSPGVAASSDASARPGRHHNQLPATADDNCAICALIHLAGAVLPSAPPALPMPAVSVPSPHQIIVQFDLTAPAGALFQARAPPIA